MTMTTSTPSRFLCALALALTLTAPTQAASVYLTPASSTANLSAGTTSLELYMDFTGTPTVGGGVDFAVTGPISIVSFTPSSFFTTSADPNFSGHGTADADGDYEVHFGNFAGLSGVNKLGDFTVGLLGLGSGNIALSINSVYGGFYNLTNQPQSVTLTGAQVDVVPLPSTVWMLLTGVGALVARRFRRS
jgi:hypothetical protein